MNLLPGRNLGIRHSAQRAREFTPIHTALLNSQELINKSNLNLSAKTEGNEKPDQKAHSFPLQRGIFTIA